MKKPTLNKPNHIILVVQKSLNQVYLTQNNMITDLLNHAMQQSLAKLNVTNLFNKT